MSGPALNPLASIAPVAPGKGPEASAADAPASQAGEAGFASELKRQMKGSKSDSADKESPRDEEAAASAAPSTIPGNEQAQSIAVVTPEMAALIAGMQPLASNPLQLDKDTTSATPDEGEALVPLFGPAGLPGSASAIDPKPASLALNPDGNAATLPAAADTTPANTAATGPKGGQGLLAAADSTTTASTVAELAARVSEPPAAAAQPTNSFAAMHAAALANLQAASPQSTPSPVPLHVATPASSPHWPEEVGNKVSWMVSNTESHAELTLTPPQLGKVEVSITVSGDQTSAQFVAATPAARELIEQNLPRLREILEQSGINLGQTDVGTSGQSAQSGDTPTGRQRSGWQSPTGGDEGPATSPVPAHWARRGEGLVDTFA
ncbi:flagellar hook-length control protein FliK [Zoogloea dura]|jgi:flagellar hook-length control protein FliK|uniref:Flagellar hook-length control protein-like C-terminal domain-containing protein n=1 Tax=Zoogloea dura TaxID=2728840 RepID=A0A848FY69_9RHOO|nr:flagellar hook-length control protein FliK [Zoogloea dura]NML24887.1 hypothetical protein [Zoogloea dura]